MASHAVPASKVKLYAKYLGWGTSAAFVVLGGISIIPIAGFSRYIIGPICVVIGLFMAILEIPVPFIAWMLNFFQDYRFRGVLYVLFCIPAFMSVFTIAPGLGAIATGACYGFAGVFKKEKGTPIERPGKKSAAGAVEGEPDVEAGSSKKGKKKGKSLASQGAAPGVI
eukprot:TRINITY_DN1462_c0_g1_i1.p3 TRINITY_DN1462_c0_g1~~TRINITY_DN1462_c0_g1_i1.p3  ORF type:complete len:191 (-),score=40.64 TRINITY_DN1462_c0_g1_i1:1048-1551(-)